MFMPATDWTISGALPLPFQAPTRQRIDFRKISPALYRLIVVHPFFSSNPRKLSGYCILDRLVRFVLISAVQRLPRTAV